MREDFWFIVMTVRRGVKMKQKSQTRQTCAVDEQDLGERLGADKERMNKARAAKGLAPR